MSANYIERRVDVGYIYDMYPSDISDKEWEILEPYFEPKKTGRPRKHDIKIIINAIRYVMRTGCQWRQLPKDFPPWKTIYS